MFYPHDKDCDETCLEKLQNRLRERIKNFYELLDFPGLVVFAAHRRYMQWEQDVPGKIEDLDRAAARLMEMRKGKPTRIVVISTDWDAPEETMQHAKYVRLRYPDAEYRWYEGSRRYTFECMHHEMNFVREVRKTICEGLNIDYNG